MSPLPTVSPRRGGAVNRLTRRTLGVVYCVAGVAKCFPAIESTRARLDQALEASTGHPEERLTRWLLEHAEEVNTGLAVSMTAAGVALIEDDGPLSDAALLMTLPMLGGFMLVLRRAIPPIIAVDLAFVIPAVYLLASSRTYR